MNIAYEEIMERYKEPINQGTIENPNLKFKDSNPLCGDEIEIQASIENNQIKNIKFTSIGCVISKASVDILSDHVNNKNIDEVSNITNDEMLELLGISVTPMRLKCALLGLIILKKGIKEYKNDTRN